MSRAPATLPPAARLKSQKDFRRVYGRGGRVTGRRLTLVALPLAPGRPARLGLSVSKEHGGAVVRNKIKRLLREAFRLERAALPPFDLVVIPRPSKEPYCRDALREELLALIAQLGQARPRAPRRRPR